MENVPNKTKRPSSITLICVLGLIVTLEIFWAVLYPSISSTLQRLGLGFTLYLAFSAVTLLACMIGLWFMKKWAIYIYTGFVFISQVALFAMRRWNLGALLLPAIILYIGYKHLSEMS